jgi:Zn-finger nucleic acid-binding protein
MNFISMSRQDEMAVELKYCERCGGLWLRRPGQELVYCERCRAQKAALLQSGRGRTARNLLQIECLRGVADTAVRP